MKKTKVKYIVIASVLFGFMLGTSTFFVIDRVVDLVVKIELIKERNN